MVISCSKWQAQWHIPFTGKALRRRAYEGDVNGQRSCHVHCYHIRGLRWNLHRGARFRLFHVCCAISNFFLLTPLREVSFILSWVASLPISPISFYRRTISKNIGYYNYGYICLSVEETCYTYSET